MNSLLSKMKLPVGAVILAAASFLIVGLVSFSGVTMANGENTNASGRLVTIYDDGEERTILTQALTVGDALNQAGIIVNQNDVVEPAIDEQLISNSYQVNVYRARPVTIIDGNVKQKIMTAYQTTEQIAKAAGIVIYPEDNVEINMTSNLVEGVGLEMKIIRAISIDLILFGKQAVVRTLADSVDKFLAEKSIILSDKDKISLSLDSPIVDDMSIRIWREGKQTVVVDEKIDFEIEIIEDADLNVGLRQIRTPGVLGEKTVIYEVLIQDDQEISRSEIASVITTQPSTQVEIVGIRGQYNTPSENETVTWNFLIEQGFSRVQTAGIMGNLMQEHRFNTTDTTGGLGIVQWIGGRRDRLIVQYPDSYTNIYSQLNFLMSELNGSYAYVRDAIKASDSLVESVQIFQNQFERCGICRESNRVSYAQTILGSH